MKEDENMGYDLLDEKIIKLLDNVMSDNNISSLQKNIDQIIEIITDEVFRQQYKSLYYLFQNDTKKIEAWGNKLKINTLEDFKIFAYAVFWMANTMSSSLYKHFLEEEQKNKEYENAKTLRKSKYLYPVLDLLEKNGELPQKAIAENLSISTNALSNFFRRNKKYGLWDCVTYKKRNYYHLTIQGKNYLESLQKGNT